MKFLFRCDRYSCSCCCSSLSIPREAPRGNVMSWSIKNTKLNEGAFLANSLAVCSGSRHFRETYLLGLLMSSPRKWWAKNSFPPTSPLNSPSSHSETGRFRVRRAPSSFALAYLQRGAEMDSEETGAVPREQIRLPGGNLFSSRFISERVEHSSSIQQLIQ